MHLVGFTIEIYFDAWLYERRNWYLITDVSGQPIASLFKVQAVQ